MSNNNLSSASLNYFAEISAVPVLHRKAYLQKLLNRKNAQFQKNLQLSKIIFKIAGQGDINKWNPDKITGKLNIPQGMFYWYTSKILNGLRGHYFKWKEIEKKIKKDFKGEPENKIDFILHKASKMFEIGMRKEAKSVLLEAEILIEKKIKKNGMNSDETLKLSAVYEFLVDYYFYQRKHIRFNLYFGKLEKLIKEIEDKKLNLSASDKSIIKIRHYLSFERKFLFKVITDKPYHDSFNYNKLAYKGAKSIGNKNYILKSVMRMGINQINMKDNDAAYNYFKEGFDITIDDKYRFEHLSFEAQMIWIDFKIRRINLSKNTARLHEIYKEASSLPAKVMWFTHIQKSFIDILYATNQNDLYLTVLKSYVVDTILNSENSNSWMFLNYYEFIKCAVNTYDWKLSNDSENKNEYLSINKVNQEALKILDKQLDAVFFNFKKVSTIRFNYDILMYRLWGEFWKGFEGDIEKSLLTIGKVERIIKTRKHLQSQNTFEVIRLGILIFDDSRYKNKKNILDKYGLKFSVLCGNIVNGKSFNTLTDYALLCYITKIVIYKELIDEVVKVYSWLKEKEPELINALINNLSKV